MYPLNDFIVSFSAIKQWISLIYTWLPINPCVCQQKNLSSLTSFVWNNNIAASTVKKVYVAHTWTAHQISCYNAQNQFLFVQFHKINCSTNYSNNCTKIDFSKKSRDASLTIFHIFSMRGTHFYHAFFTSICIQICGKKVSDL